MTGATGYWYKPGLLSVFGTWIYTVSQKMKRFLRYVIAVCCTWRSADSLPYFSDSKISVCWRADRGSMQNKTFAKQFCKNFAKKNITISRLVAEIIKSSKLENVQWISIPQQIGDPIPWRHLSSDVWKFIGIQVSPLLISWQRMTFGGG